MSAEEALSRRRPNKTIMAHVQTVEGKKDVSMRVYNFTAAHGR